MKMIPRSAAVLAAELAESLELEILRNSMMGMIDPHAETRLKQKRIFGTANHA